VDDDELDAEAVEQVEIVDDAEERFVGDDFAAECDDESLAAERVYIGRRRANPVHERAHGRGVRGWGDVRGARHRRMW
jgi:hypothetical protein